MNIKKICKTTALMALFAIIFIIPFAVYADNPTVAGPSDPWEIFRNVAGPAFMWIGFAMIIFGAIEMGFAFRSDEPEGIRKGMMVAMSGGALAIIAHFATTLMTITSGDTTMPLDTSGAAGVDTTQMQTFINQLTIWIPMLGAIVAFWGFFELSKSMKSDDAGGKQKALTIVVSGMVLFVIIPLMKWVLWGIPPM